MAIPHILSAIPLKRYQYGEFSITLLGEITTDDPINYLFILAVMREGNAQPEVYITYESNKLDDKTMYKTRVLSDQQEHLISELAERQSQSEFCDFALQGVQQMFELSDEQPVLLS